ncbi:MAG: helix-turn-helix domain-containing protein [Candidatus Faecivicinus sp.]
MKLYWHNGRCNQAGVRIREAREQLGLSQEELAAKLQLAGLEITQKSISRIETGLRVLPDYELPYFAAALNRSIPWLLS